jgi:hypothetical protein
MTFETSSTSCLIGTICLVVMAVSGISFWAVVEGGLDNDIRVRVFMSVAFLAWGWMINKIRGRVPKIALGIGALSRGLRRVRQGRLGLLAWSELRPTDAKGDQIAKSSGRRKTST